eukprot:Tbor_TRINITY_DN5575_c1_g2::TRINITY_DN5575_c1_g2_i1::g.13931::m.13931/K19682/IFT46; intraflagellar transport protein 46
MPPKRQFKDSDDSDDDEDETTSEEESSDSSDSMDMEETKVTSTNDTTLMATDGTVIMNKPHDIVFNVEGESERVPTPQGPSIGRRIGTPESPGTGDNVILRNNPNDELFAADGEEVDTPPRKENRLELGVASGAQKTTVTTEGNILRNASHDEFSDVDEDMQHEIITPRVVSKAPRTDGETLQNNPYDLAFDADGESVASAGDVSPGHLGQTPGDVGMASPTERESDDTASGTDTDEDSTKAPKMGDIAVAAAQAGKGADVYNPADYAYLNSKLPRDVVELFGLIENYQPLEMELPAKFRPFIPDYIPCVGDMDTFCKIPRPDGYPDNFGLVVVDEPSSKQSNPAVVKISLAHSSKLAPKATFVHSLQNAHQKPEEIDRWVKDIQNIDKKPLTTVNYSRPMPSIDQLLQEWPQEFEELLTSDIQFPPHNIDLDIAQYVRLLCAILDIPVYENIIESLHVMFTLYLEFRQNQHFQHV